MNSLVILRVHKYLCLHLQCFSERFSDVSDACVDAAHAADTYMASNREVMKVALKEVAVKDTFEQFQTSCSAEIATKCHGPLADPSLAVANLLASLPQSDHESRGDRWRGQHEHRRLRKLHHDEPSSDEEQGMSGKDAKALELLSRYV